MKNRTCILIARISPTVQESVLQGYVNVIGLCAHLHYNNIAKNTMCLTPKSNLSAHMYIFWLSCQRNQVS